MDSERYATIVRADILPSGSVVYVAWHPELPTVISQSDSAEQAQAELAEATQMALEHLREHHLPIPVRMLLTRETGRAPAASLRAFAVVGNDAGDVEMLVPA